MTEDERHKMVLFMRSTTMSGINVGEKTLVPVLFLRHKGSMMKRYEVTFSTGPEAKSLIFPEGTFENLPFEVRLTAPWIGCEYIDPEKLKPTQRLEIMRQGYLLIHEGETRIRDAA